MIPKIIHYIWFGGKELPSLALHCISSWKKFCPDYKIIRWDESNYDVYKNPYIAQAYDAGKYAFVSDYARFDILYNYGGVYFDTDVEVLKNIDDICAAGPWLGLEDKGGIASGLGLASSPGLSIIKEILQSYEKDSFINLDGSYNLMTVVTRVSKIFYKYGFVNEDKMQFIEGFTIYPKEFFCPKDGATGIMNITGNTHTIHHYDSSWLEEWEQNLKFTKYNLISHFGNNPITKVLCNMLHIYKAFINKGPVQGSRYIKAKIKSNKTLSKEQVTEQV